MDTYSIDRAVQKHHSEQFGLFGRFSSANGFQASTDYVLGRSGEQVTEMSVNNNVATWAHTNAWAGGTLLATYDIDGLHFYITDPLGSRRVQTDYAGVVERTCQSLPFGDGETCTPTPTEHLFTGKERDSESGNDYFKYRYYASSMGRWLSPDPAGMMAADLADPQSLNRYAYVQNNPLSFTDPLGLDCAYLNSSGGYDHMNQTISAGGCTNSGGYWVNGGLTNYQIDANNNTITLTGTTNGTDTTTASYVPDQNNCGCWLVLEHAGQSCWPYCDGDRRWADARARAAKRFQLLPRYP